MTTVRRGVGRGDLVKRKHAGGHVMTVASVDVVNRTVVASYTTPDGVLHNEEWRAEDLKRVVL